MASLRDRWHRSLICNYFDGLDRTDRATALIALVLLLAFVLSFSAIVRTREPWAALAPGLTAPPFTMDFAVDRATPVPA